LALVIVILAMTSASAFAEEAQDPGRNDAQGRPSTQARAPPQASIQASRDWRVERIPRFSAKNASLFYVVNALNRLGVPLCHEEVHVPGDPYVDSDGVGVFYTGTLLSLDLSQATVPEILDKICALDTRYKWENSDGLVALMPRLSSRLALEVGPIKQKSSILDVLRRASSASGTSILMPLVIIGPPMPVVDIDLPRCTAADLLSAIARQHAGMTWHVTERAAFSQFNGWARAVEIEFPQLRKGKASNVSSYYDIVERLVNGVPTVVIEKRPVRAIIDE